MRLVIQRVTEASVSIGGEVRSSIGAGLLILVGVEQTDTEKDVDWLVKKTAAMRIFNDAEGVMNLSVMDVRGEALVVSQFTLMADCRKGNRPSWFRAASHDISIPLYNLFCQRLSATMNQPVKTGEFGADMKVALVNDGPVTIILDSKS